MVSFRPVDAAAADDVEAVRRWANDERIRHLFQRFRNADELVRRWTAEETARALARTTQRLDLILADGVPVGSVSLKLDSPELLRRRVRSAWIGLVVGEAGYRRRGLGTAAMEHIEEAARRAGAVRAEIGVFEFNAPARALYASLGYEQIARLEAFTYWAGRRWANLRYEKSLV